MFDVTWLAYFEGNARPDCPPAQGLSGEVAPLLRAPLAQSLGRFQLGEASGGRLHHDVLTDPDRALTGGARRSIQLYIEEEWRHSRELALIVQALGGQLQHAHWTNAAFTACRRLLGLRTKMMTLAVAEVVGIVYYRALAHSLGSAALSVSLRRIADEEGRHLDFQAAFFERALSVTPRRLCAPYRWLLRALLGAIFTAALSVLWLDHRQVLKSVGQRPSALLGAAWRELSSRRFLAAGSLAALSRPRYVSGHERRA